MLFWLAVSPSSSALIAQSTAGQCSVVKRAPMPSVLRPRLPPVPGRMVESASCYWMGFFSLSRLDHEAGKNVAPAWATPSASGETSAWSFHAQSPLAFSSSVQSPAVVEKRLLEYSVTFPVFTPAGRAGQSRQKSGLAQGFCAARSVVFRREELMADMERQRFTTKYTKGRISGTFVSCI